MICTSVFPQKVQHIEIINANNTFGDSKNHPEYWRLIGEVSFKHNNIIMNCDSAYHFRSVNKIKAFGKIKINQGDSLYITGQKLSYFGKKNKIHIQGDVILKDKYMMLETKQIYYDLNSNTGYYPQKGKILNNEKIITSKTGIYHSKIHKFIFNDSVIVSAKDYTITTDTMHYFSNSEISLFYGPSYIVSKKNQIYCEYGWYNTKSDIGEITKNSYINTENYILKSDTIIYEKKLGYIKAINNVQLIDTLEHITVFGGLGEYFELKNKAKIQKKPILQLLLKEDTLFMHANQFIYQKKEKKQLLAYNKVKFFKTDFQGKCDSLSYNINDSLIRMFIEPILWSNEFQITADSIKFMIYEEEIKKMFLKPNPMIISKEDSIDYNQIKGKEMIAFFDENKMNKIDIIGNGQSIFIVNDDEKNNAKIGLNYIESTNLCLYFQENKLKNVTYHIQPSSTSIPYQDTKEEDRYLKGFSSRESERPKKMKDIFIE